MAKMIILRGVSGSGKSTWARNQTGAIVVSRDAIRVMLFGDDGPDYYKVDKDVLSAREGQVTLVQDAMIKSALEAGRDVIVDNTNIEWKYVKALAKIAHRVGAEVEVRKFDVPVDSAISRDIHRSLNGGRLVGADIIRKQHSRFQGTKDNTLEPAFVPTPYEGTPGKPKAFLVDIDGTLAHMKNRSPFDWKRVGEDDVDEVISELVWDIWAGSNLRGDDDTYRVIVMSGRDGSCIQETTDWLAKHEIQYDLLFMREAGDMRPDNIIKAELFDKYVRDNFDVKFVLDDRDAVVAMWRQMGLTCLQVNYGDF